MDAKEVENCIEILNHGDYESCKQVVDTLLKNKWFEKSENIPIIIELLNDEKVPTRLFTLKSVPDEVYFFYDKLFTELKKALTDSNYDIQIVALDKFRFGLGFPFIDGKKGQVKKIEPIIPILKDLMACDDERISRKSAGLLAQIAYNEPEQFEKVKDDLVKYYQKTNDSNIPHYMQHTEYANLFQIERTDKNEPVQVQMDPKLLKLINKFKGMRGFEIFKKHEGKVVEYLLENPDNIYDFIAFYLQDVVGHPPGRHMTFEERMPGGYRIIDELLPLIDINDNVYSLIIETFSNPNNIERRRMRAASLFGRIGLFSRKKFYEYINTLITSENYTALKGTLVAIHEYSKNEPIEKITLNKLLNRLFDDDKQFLDHLLFIIAFTCQDNYRLPANYEERLNFIYKNVESFGNTWVHEESWKENCMKCISLLDITSSIQQDRILKLCMEHVSSNVYPTITFQCFENLADQIEDFDNEVIEFLLLELAKRTKIGDRFNVGQIKKILNKIENNNLDSAVEVYKTHSESSDKWLSRFCQRKLNKLT